MIIDCSQLHHTKRSCCSFGVFNGCISIINILLVCQLIESRCFLWYLVIDCCISILTCLRFCINISLQGSLCCFCTFSFIFHYLRRIIIAAFETAILPFTICLTNEDVSYNNIICLSANLFSLYTVRSCGISKYHSPLSYTWVRITFSQRYFGLKHSKERIFTSYMSRTYLTSYTKVMMNVKVSKHLFCSTYWSNIFLNGGSPCIAFYIPTFYNAINDKVVTFSAATWKSCLNSSHILKLSQKML